MKYDRNAISNTARNLSSKAAGLSSIRTSLSRLSPKRCNPSFYSRRSSLARRLQNVQNEITSLSSDINNAASRMSTDDVQNANQIRQVFSNRTSLLSYQPRAFSTGNTTLGKSGVFGSTLLYSQASIGRTPVVALGNAASGSDPWYKKAGNFLKSGASYLGKKASEAGAAAWKGTTTFFSNAGKWGADRLNDLANAGKAAGSYIWKSVTKFVLGDYSNKDITVLSFVGNIAAGIADVDLPLDIRDLVYDVQHWGEGDHFGLYLALDVVALLPIIGAIKYSKYADDVGDGAKDLGKVVDAASDAGKATDNAADAVDDAADIGKKVDAASDAGKLTGNIPRKPLSELPENVQDSYKKYEDVNWNGNFVDATPGTSAGKKYKNRDDMLPGVDKDGNAITYKEFDVNNLPEGATSRDGCRFIKGSDGSVYYTSDHYKTFIKIE